MTFTLHRGQVPLLVSCPHSGTAIPGPIATRLRTEAMDVPDTDWYVDRLYAFTRDLGASMIVPVHSRYVIDLNRAPDGHALYPGRRETGLVPIISFADTPLYRDGAEPDAAEFAARIDAYWRPYHEALEAELARLKAQHGQVILWDAHSIRSEVPMFFEGRLPDLNLGTAGGTSAGAGVTAAITAAMGAQSDLSWVVNGRFKGGYITRRFGDPANGVHAVQMEMAQDCYMDETPPAWNDGKATRAADVLARLVQAALAAV